jgi:type I restriction enzyme, S subunit
LARREIDILREYQARLVADVVTGRLDVRKAAAHLPDDIDLPEPFDDVDPEETDDPMAEGLEAVEA